MSARRLHECAAPGCSEQISLSLLMCKPHWYSLPKRLRDAVWAAYRAGKVTGRLGREYVAAVRAAQAWLEEHR